MSWWWPFGKQEEQPVQQGNSAANAPSDMLVPVKEESQGVPSMQELLNQDKELDQLSSEAGLTAAAAKPKAKKKKAKAKKAAKKPVKKAVKKAKKKK